MSDWQIRVDTGGTFTDCLALDPAGRLHRAKVLSTGALRGRLVRVLDARRLAIEHRWAVPDDLKGPAVFLASAASDYLHGIVLPVDGGFLAR